MRSGERVHHPTTGDAWEIVETNVTDEELDIRGGCRLRCLEGAEKGREIVGHTHAVEAHWTAEPPQHARAVDHAPGRAVCPVCGNETPLRLREAGDGTHAPILTVAERFYCAGSGDERHTPTAMIVDPGH